MENQIDELIQKQRKITFLLGELIYKLYGAQAIRFLYTSDGVEEETEVQRMLRLLDYLNERIKKLEEIYSEEYEQYSEELADQASNEADAEEPQQSNQGGIAENAGAETCDVKTNEKRRAGMR